MSSCWTTAIRKSRSTNLLQFGSKAPLKKLRNLSLGLSLSLWRGSRRIRSWLRAFGSLKLASRCCEDTDLNEQRPATNRQGIVRMLAWFEEILEKKNESLSRQTYVASFLQVTFRDSCIATWSSNRPTVQGELPPPYTVISFYFHIFHKHEYIATGPLNFHIPTTRSMI